ncbi:photosynthetic NDH subunit of subcomplex B 5, chloroplastic-like isoform X1 [Hibiscus syriacus]|uniref:photosynthetic NDH subunit of subcomplex B 5, chloroplastic-like isoform X1 n=1 Tax=Hibiscus syriacus TaxID=106335 RepID=UPI0019237DC9|nr:photosynthetic NDH subunit of subcomplex B 5, chloroplastic-like isoform X1 [Hibiscus syriacus]
MKTLSEDFKYGEYDGHHTYFEGEEEKGTFWGAIADDIQAIEPTTGFQAKSLHSLLLFSYINFVIDCFQLLAGLLSWLFLPAVAAGMFFNAPGEYLFIGGGVFTIIFCIIEMDKPDKPHHFEPQIYNMERGARAKLINDYNTMSIWGFNEKYGDLWDFTIKKDDITKR